MGTLLAQSHAYFLAPRNIETSVTYLSFFTLLPVSLYQAGKSHVEQISKRSYFELQGFSLSCIWLTHAPTPTLPIILWHILSVLLLIIHCACFQFLLVDLPVIAYISAWNQWCSERLDSYVAKFRGPADLCNSTPQFYIHLKLDFSWAASNLIQEVNPWKLSFPQGIHLLFK